MSEHAPLPARVHQMDSYELDDAELLPSGRIGRRIKTKETVKLSQPVFVGTDGRVMCRHGEHASYVTLLWSVHPDNNKSDENIAKAKAKQTLRCPLLQGPCDCRNLDGLLTSYKIKERDWPTKPANRAELFKFLDSKPNTERKTIDGVLQLHVCTWKGTSEGHNGSSIWLQKDGSLACPHGCGPTKIDRAIYKRKRGKKLSSDCGCTLSILKRKDSVLESKKICIKHVQAAAVADKDA